MNQGDLDQRLSSISTIWTVLRQAHEGDTEATRLAQELVVRRYGGAVYRYLLGALRDPAVAEDLRQEFALALIQGGFRRADPARGRFRNYVKTSLFHLVSKYRKGERRGPELLPPEHPQLTGLTAPAEEDAAFDAGWRAELLARTWEDLGQTVPTLYAVLRFRFDHSEMPSAEMARQLAQRLDKPLTAVGVRQALHRARFTFADLLLERVAQSLDVPTAERVEEELRDLNLLSYCKPALDRYRR